MSQFKIKDNKKTENDELYIEAFTFFGKHDFVDDEGFPMVELTEEDLPTLFESPDIFALKLQSEGRTKYYVKRGKYGKLYNPIGMYTEGTNHKQMRHAGKPEWVFRDVSKKIFIYYTQFLRTKNPAWLNNAEREI